MSKLTWLRQPLEAQLLWFLMYLQSLPRLPHVPILGFQWFGFVYFVSCGTENNLHWLWQLMDSAGASEHEAGTEKHIWRVCGLEVSGRGSLHAGPPTSTGQLCRQWVQQVRTQSTSHATCLGLCFQNPAKGPLGTILRIFLEVPAH